jgi:hypothetical protein
MINKKPHTEYCMGLFEFRNYIQRKRTLNVGAASQPRPDVAAMEPDRGWEAAPTSKK